MRFWSRFKKDKLGMLSLLIILIIMIAGILAPVIAPNDPTLIDVKIKFMGMSMKYPFGTDQLGRCVFSRILYGIRTTVFLSIVTMIATIAIGTIFGVIAAFFRGFVDEVIMRICDIMLSFPSEVMILSIVGIMGIGINNIIITRFKNVIFKNIIKLNDINKFITVYGKIFGIINRNPNPYFKYTV